MKIAISECREDVSDDGVCKVFVLCASEIKLSYRFQACRDQHLAGMSDTKYVKVSSESEKTNNEEAQGASTNNSDETVEAKNAVQSRTDQVFNKVKGSESIIKLLRPI